MDSISEITLSNAHFLWWEPTSVEVQKGYIPTPFQREGPPRVNYRINSRTGGVGEILFVRAKQFEMVLKNLPNLLHLNNCNPFSYSVEVMELHGNAESSSSLYVDSKSCLNKMKQLQSYAYRQASTYPEPMLKVNRLLAFPELRHLTLCTFLL